MAEAATAPSFLEKTFGIARAGSTPRREILAGVTTFLTMSYIIFVQPAFLSGLYFGFETPVMDFGAVLTATCLASAIATAIMGLLARYPIAQAPGMGANALFILTAVPAAAAAGFEDPWQVALGIIFVEGILFLILVLSGLRAKVMHSVSNSMKHGIAVGIGLFIAFIGLQNSGLVEDAPGVLVSLNENFQSPDLIVFFVGVLVTAALMARRVAGAILWGILAAAAVAVGLKLTLHLSPWGGSTLVAESVLATRFQLPEGVVSAPPSIEPTFLKLDILGALSLAMIPYVLMFLFLDFFDTMGTLIGVSERAGLLDEDGNLPRANKAFASDAVGTTVGALLGTSTVTSYIESASGVEQGGRTGLVALTVSLLFLVALFFEPIIQMVGSYPSITAPALVIVGAMMASSVTRIDWADGTESIPAFLTMIGIPLFYSIGDGLALGLVSYAAIKALAGRAREVGWVMGGLALVLVLYFIFVRSRLG
ncbi:MAG: NCS2 family permease [Sumerlaeia bacterium]